MLFRFHFHVKHDRFIDAAFTKICQWKNEKEKKVRQELARIRYLAPAKNRKNYEKKNISKSCYRQYFGTDTHLSSTTQRRWGKLYVSLEDVFKLGEIGF